MRHSVHTTLYLAILGLLAAGCAPERGESSGLGVSDGALRWNGEAFLIRAIETPNLATAGFDPEEMEAILDRVAAAGGNAVALTLPPGAGDGARGLDAATAEAQEAILAATRERDIAVVYRLVGPDAPDNPERHMDLTLAAARTFRDAPNVICWIDAPNAGALTEAFLRRAPNVVTLSSSGGALTPVHDPDAFEPGGLDVLIGNLPEQDPQASHFILPPYDEMYDVLEAAMAGGAAAAD